MLILYYCTIYLTFVLFAFCLLQWNVSSLKAVIPVHFLSSYLQYKAHSKCPIVDLMNF